MAVFDTLNVLPDMSERLRPNFRIGNRCRHDLPFARLLIVRTRPDQTDDTLAINDPTEKINESLSSVVNVMLIRG
jgi:hypothetical protein